MLQRLELNFADTNESISEGSAMTDSHGVIEIERSEPIVIPAEAAPKKAEGRPLAGAGLGTAELENLIADAPHYRRVATASDYARPTVLVCVLDEVDKARKWFKSVAGRNPDHIVLMEDGRLRAAGLDIAALPSMIEHAFIVFGKNIRRKCIVLALHGVRNVFFDKDQNYRTGRTRHDFYSSARDKVAGLANTLSDWESVLTLCSIIRHRTSGDHGYLRIANYEEYDHPEVGAKEGDVVIDAGAFDGRTSLAFAEKVGAGGMVYAFEPDETNRITIGRNVGALATGDSGKIQVVDAALAEKDGFIQFASVGTGSSSITETGGTFVRTVSIDSFMATTNLDRINLISLDVEGYEPNVLVGALQTIRKHRPRLQISIYHDMNHLFDIVAWLTRNIDDYRYYIGHHNSYSTETDLYIVPAGNSVVQAR